MDYTKAQPRGEENIKLHHAILPGDNRVEYSTDNLSEDFFTDEFKDSNWQPARAERIVGKIKRAARSLNLFFDK